MTLKHNNVGLAFGFASALALFACGSKTSGDGAMSPGDNEAMMTDEGGAMNSGDAMSGGDALGGVAISSGNALGPDDHTASGNTMSSDATASGGNEGMGTNARSSQPGQATSTARSSYQAPAGLKPSATPFMQ